MKTSNLPDDPEFAATARAYGGARAHAQAQTSGRTNLNYQQWVQVRTPTFKEWFGDWEKAALRTLLDGQAVADVHSGEVPQTGLADVRQWATRILQQQGGTAENPEIGHVVLDEHSVRSSLGHGKPNRFKYAAFVAVKDVLEQGTIVHRTTRERMDSYYISAPVKIDSVDDVVTVLVHRDYNTQRMYLHSVATKESLLRRRGSSVDADKASERSGSSSAGDVASVLHDALNFNGEISKAVVPETGEPLVLYRGTEAAFAAFSREHPRDGLPTQPGLFFTRTPAPSSDTAHPVFLIAKTPDGAAIDHIHDGDAWLVLDPAQVQNAVGNPLSLDRDDPTIVQVNSSAGDQTMANPIQNESAVYGIAPQAEPDNSLIPPNQTQEPWRLANGVVDDVLYYAEGQERYDEAIRRGDHALAEDILGSYNLAYQQELSGFTLESYARDYDEAHRLNAEMGKQIPVEPSTPTQYPANPSTEKPATRKRARKAKSGTPSPVTPTAETPKRERSGKAKEVSTAEPTPAILQGAVMPPPAPSPLSPPAGVATLDPHAQQRLNRVSSNRAADLADAKKKLDADAVNRARIHLLQDPIGRHIVAIDQGGVTKAYAVDENPGIAAKTVNTLRDGMRKIGNLAGEISFLPDVIKTRFRLKSGEEKIAYNVDPEGVDPRHPQMREAGLGENDRRNLVVIPEGNPDEISKHVLLSSNLPDDVKKRFVYSDTVPGQYFDRNRKLAFIDKGSRLATDQNAPEIIASMVSVAQAKGWKAISLKGGEDFRREAWLAASLAGIEVKGFKPSDPDLAQLEYERQLRMGNAIQPAMPTPAPVTNEMVGTAPDAPPPAIGAEAVALGEVARLKGVREDQIPNFMKTAQAFIDEAKRAGIDLPALKVFDPVAPSAPTVATPDKTKQPARGIDIPQPDKAPKR